MVKKLLVQLLVAILALSPAWFFLGVRALAAPEGFWQNLALFGIGVWILGSAQFIFLFIGLGVSLMIWSE